jgi:hypothetical protein
MPEAISSSPLEMAPKLTGIQGLFTCLRFAKKKLIEMLVDPTKASENGYKLQGQQSSSQLVLARSGPFKFCCTQFGFRFRFAWPSKDATYTA